MKEMIFKNREEAGKLLAEKLAQYKGKGVIVLGIPRGGVPVAAEIASRLNAKLDIVLSKKIGHPLNPEFAIGSVSPDSVILDEHEGVSEDYIKSKVDELRDTLRKRNKLYRGNRPSLVLNGKTVIIADDGIATGNTLFSAIEMLRRSNAEKIIVACPVVPSDRVGAVKKSADEFVYLYAPDFFSGVAEFYKEFEQVSDEEVVRILSSES